MTVTRDRTLWIVSAGAEAVPGIQRARAMGLHVVVSDMNPNAPGFAVADEAVVANTYDVDGTIAAATKYHRTKRPIDGVMCMAADVPMTVAGVAAALDLPGIPIESARLAADKLAMKEAFRRANVPIPWFQAIESLQALIEVVRDRGFPLVLKPIDGRGARGVLRLTEATDLAWAFSHASSQSRRGGVMVEEYLAGPQISTEGLLVSGEGTTCGFIDRNYEYLDRFAPYIVENGGEQPSAIAPAAQRRIAAAAMDAGRAMGISSGSVKGDMVWTDRGPCVIEIAARLSGGWMSTDQVPLGTGVDLIGCAIRLALGEQVPAEDLRPRWHRGVAIRYFFPPPGRVAAIDGADAFAAIPWVHRLGFFVQRDETVCPVTDHTKRAGFVITTGATREDAVARACSVVDAIAIRTD
ncbi:MAG TPA: ATP-grasp domain-containing protein [Vicinamibacterales bacterium]|nr:ATP-grasp domain-containing protein [Vicinamibacterales bacterium]